MFQNSSMINVFFLFLFLFFLTQGPRLTTQIPVIRCLWSTYTGAYMTLKSIHEESLLAKMVYGF